MFGEGLGISKKGFNVFKKGFNILNKLLRQFLSNIKDLSKP